MNIDRLTQASRQLARRRVKCLLGKGPASNLQFFFASLRWWPFFAPWWLLITVRRTPPFWKRVIRNCSWRLQDLSNLVLLTAARPRNQGFPRIAQYCRGQFFSTGLFFCQPGRYLEPRHIFLRKTGFIEATARFGSWWWVHLRQKILEQFDRNTTSSCDGNAYYFYSRNNGVKPKQIVE